MGTEHRRSVSLGAIATIGLNVYLYIPFRKLSFLNKPCAGLCSRQKYFIPVVKEKNDPFYAAS